MRSQTPRAQPRVPYPVEVHLHAPAQSRAARGRSVNVSSSGIFIQANQAFEVGTKVICELPLPGGTRHLAGMVARLQPLANQAAGVGMGIRFVDLDRAAEGLLRNLVADAEPRTHAVNIRFEGLERELRSQAVLTAEGIRLQTALPFLAPGTDVAVAFLAGPSKVLSHGLVQDVRVEIPATDGTPRLTVNLHMPSRVSPVDRLFDADEVTEVTAVESPRALATAASAQLATTSSGAGSAATAPAILVAPSATNSGITRRIFSRAARRPLRARGRARSRPGAGGAMASGAGPASGAVTAAGTVAASDDARPALAAPAVRPPILRLVRGAAFATVGLGLVALGAGITAYQTQKAPAAPNVETIRATDPIRSIAERRPPNPIPSLAPPRPSPSRTGAPAAPPASAAHTRPEPPPKANPPVVPAEVAPPTPSTPPAKAEAPATTRGPATPPAPVGAGDPAGRPRLVMAGVPAGPISPPPLPEDTAGPEMRLEQGLVTAVIPIRGSTEGWSQFRVEVPQGLVINLPHAEAVLPLGRHPVYNEGFRFVWIRARDRGGIQVRLQLAYRTPELRAVEVTADAVIVRVAPPPPPGT